MPSLTGGGDDVMSEMPNWKLPQISPDTTERFYPIRSVVSSTSTPSSTPKSPFWGEDSREPLFPEHSWNQSIKLPLKIVKLFGAHYAVSSMSGKTRILGKPPNPQEVLALVEYLKIKGCGSTLVSTDITNDFEDLNYPPGFTSISNIFYIPLSADGQDFVAFFKNVTPPLASSSCDEDATQAGQLPPVEDIWPAQEEKASILSLAYKAFTDARYREEAVAQDSQLMKLLLGNFAHELRTPLNAVMNHLEMALDESLKPETRESLARSHSAAKSLVYIINDLLDLTNAEIGNRLTKEEEFNLTETIEEAAAIFYEEARQKHIGLYVTHRSSLPAVLGDQRRIRQVITNLIGNAINHTTTGAVTVESQICEHDNPESIVVEIAIHDTGCGMPKASIDNLFYELEQVSKEEFFPQPYLWSHEKVGCFGSSKNVLGLGLALVARIARNMDGRLSVKSEQGKGSCFKVTLEFPLLDTGLSNLITDTQPVVKCQGARQTKVKRAGELDKSWRFKDSSKKRKESPAREDSYDFIDCDSEINDAPLQGRSHQLYEDSISEGKDALNAERYPAHLDTDSIFPTQLSDSSNETAQETPSTTSTNSQNTIDINLISHATTPSPTNAIRNASKPNLHILVAEDDPVNRAIVRRRLTKMGHTVHLTENGKDCASMYQEYPLCFEVVLMDLQMPVVDGLTATKMIRDCERLIFKGTSNDHHDFQRVAIFAISASLIEKDRQKYIDSGFDGWFMKPVDFRRVKCSLDGLYAVDARNQNAYEAGRWEKGGWFEKKINGAN